MPLVLAQREPLFAPAPKRDAAAADRSVLITERLVLRPLASWDERPFLAAVSATRADLNRFCPLHRPGESDEALFERHFAMSTVAAVTGKAVRLVVTLAKNPEEILGAVNINNVTYGLEARGTLNWWLAPSARGRSIGAEAIEALFAHAFSDLPFGRGLHRLDGLIDPANFPSLRLAERMRMRPQPGQYERVMINGEAKVHQLYCAFAPTTAMLPASMVELKPLPGLDAILRGSIRI